MVVPSLSLPQDELRRITAVRSYEERLLFLLLTLKNPTWKSSTCPPRRWTTRSWTTT
ncbi:hypothetical protein ACFQX6_34035 [Streptosporangium lutulentum]